MSLLLGGGMAVLVLLIFLVFPVALRLFDYRPDLIAESWRYISWVLPAYMLAMVYISQCATASSPPAAAAGS